MDIFPKTFQFLQKITLLLTFSLVFFLTFFYSENQHTRSDYESPIITNSEQRIIQTSFDANFTKIKEPIKPRDPKAIVLENYLHTQISPLAKQSDLIVDLSKLYGVDYKMVVAIAGLESGYCAENSFSNNCWGFGTYSWGSMDIAVKEYMRLMNKGYFSKGLRSIAEIAPMYNSANTAHFLEIYKIHYNKIP